jgi:hypothetical protein
MIHGVLQPPLSTLEGSRPGPAAAGPFAKPRAFPDQGRKYTVGFENVFAAHSLSAVPRAGGFLTTFFCANERNLFEIAGLTTDVV